MKYGRRRGEIKDTRERRRKRGERDRQRESGGEESASNKVGKNEVWEEA